MYAAHIAPAAKREAGADRVEPVEAALAEQGHPGQGQPRPAPGGQPAGGAHRQRERSEHLQGDRRTERDPVDGLVEDRVHPGQGQPEGHHRGPVGAVVAAQPGPAHDQHQQRADGQPQGHRAGHAGAREEQRGDRRAELHRQRATEHQPDRPEDPAPRGVVRRRWWPGGHGGRR